MTAPDGALDHDKAAKPRRGAAEDGKAGGRVHRGTPGKANFHGHHTSGHNAQTGVPSGSETERHAPGISTDKKADDTK